MGPIGSGDFAYALVLKDHFSGYVSLAPCQAQDSRTSALHIVEWVMNFGFPKVVISDNGTPFTAALVRNVLAGWNVDQHFATAYCAWSNGAVERVNREIIALTRKLLAEKRETLTTWPNLIPFIQSTLNKGSRHAWAGTHPSKCLCITKDRNRWT